MAKKINERVEFYTQRTLNELVSILREQISKFKASVDKIKSDPFDDPAQSYDVEVVLYGKAHGLLAFRAGCAYDMWAVQVYIEDLGAKRHVIMIALGEKDWLRREGELLHNINVSRDKMETLVGLMK